MQAWGQIINALSMGGSNQQDYGCFRVRHSFGYAVSLQKSQTSFHCLLTVPYSGIFIRKGGGICEEKQD